MWAFGGGIEIAIVFGLCVGVVIAQCVFVEVNSIAFELCWCEKCEKNGEGHEGDDSRRQGNDLQKLFCRGND